MLCCLAGLGEAAPQARAQEWVRENFTQPDVVTGRGGSTSGAGMRMGAMDGALALHAGLRYNDNIRLEPTGVGGLAVEVGATVGLRLPVSQHNELTFDATISREVYLTGLSGTRGYQTLQPGSELALNAYVGRVKLRGFLAGRLQEDPISAPVLGSTEQFSRLNVDAGVQADWDLNRLVLQGQVATGRQEELRGGVGSLDAWRDRVGLRAVFPLAGGNAWGLEGSVARTRFDLDVQNDGTFVSGGAFARQTFGRNRRLQVGGGYLQANYERGGAINDRDDYAGLYGNLQFDHQLRRNLRYTLMLREDLMDGVGSNYFRLTTVALTPQWQVFSRGTLSLNGSHEWIDESGAAGEEATRLGWSIAYKTPLGRRFDGAISWQYFRKDSDQPGRGYERNLAAVMFTYTL